MKYMLLIYADEKAWTDDERQACYKESAQLTHKLHEQGKYLAASPLHPVATATSVRVRENKRMVTDGPFAETREQLGGYFLIEAENLDEAIDVAGRIPGAKKGTVEIRPVMAISGLPGHYVPLPRGERLDEGFIGLPLERKFRPLGPNNPSPCPSLRGRGIHQTLTVLT
jgi:hypothetical protein